MVDPSLKDFRIRSVGAGVFVAVARGDSSGGDGSLRVCVYFMVLEVSLVS